MHASDFHFRLSFLVYEILLTNVNKLTSTTKVNFLVHLLFPMTVSTNSDLFQVIAFIMASSGVILNIYSDQELMWHKCLASIAVVALSLFIVSEQNKWSLLWLSLCFDHEYPNHLTYHLFGSNSALCVAMKQCELGTELFIVKHFTCWNLFLLGQLFAFSSHSCHKLETLFWFRTVNNDRNLYPFPTILARTNACQSNIITKRSTSGTYDHLC